MTEDNLLPLRGISIGTGSIEPAPFKLYNTIYASTRGRNGCDGSTFGMKTGMGSLIWGGGTDSVGRFLGELRRRRVWRTAFAYAAVVFVLLQLGEIVFPAFGAPDLALRLLVVACFLGFPLTLALAWVFDITPGGIQKSDSEAPPAGQDRYVGWALPRLAFLAVTLATVGGVGWWALQDTLGAETGTRALPPEGATAASVPLSEAAPQIRSLAVLPLEDFSQGVGGEYFTAGLHEELIFQLSQIASARVLSRTTVVQYDQGGKTMPVIAEELGVEGVVEGSVFRDSDRVKVTVQLIHGPTDRHVWSNVYEGTMEDAIALQRTVAQAIASEIQAELFPADALPTEAGVRVAASPKVQEEYLRARYEQSKSTPQDLESAVSHYRAALALDSTFVPAYVGLAGAKVLLGFQSGDSTAMDPASDEEVARALEQALKLDSRSSEARAILLTLGRIPGSPSRPEAPLRLRPGRGLGGSPRGRGRPCRIGLRAPAPGSPDRPPREERVQPLGEPASRQRPEAPGRVHARAGRSRRA